jgi:glycosyltransferase involved in cell wall biosynthesis
VGGPPEFVTPDAGILVDPEDTDGLVAALERAASMPSPNPAARKAASEHDVKFQAARMSEVLVRATRGGS